MSNKNSLDQRRRNIIVAGCALTITTVLRPLPALAQMANGKLRIGVIGSGHIGGTIGSLWIKAGHPVLFSSRHPDELNSMVSQLGSLAQAGTVEQAIAFGDVIFIAVPYGAMPQLGEEYAGALKGKIVLDAGNATVARDGAIADEVERMGIGITSQKYLPGARLVRAFNTLSYMIFSREAHRTGPKLAIPIAGDDAEAMRVAAQLVEDAGFEPVVVGNLTDARRFQRGNPGYGQAVTAAELRHKLTLAP